MKIKIKKYKKVRSTNDIALKLIKQSVSKPTLVTTEKQTNGRGTIGKKWISKKGNLFISLFFQFDQKKINFKQFAILNALILKKVISKTISKNIKIKWPNDLMFNKMKICGILQEVIKFENFDYLIVGIGLNTNINPKNSGRVIWFIGPEGGWSNTELLFFKNKKCDYYVLAPTVLRMETACIAALSQKVC